MEPVAELYAQGGDIKKFLRQQKEWFDNITKYQLMLEPEMSIVLKSVILDLEDALQNLHNVALSMIPFWDFDEGLDASASYSLTPKDQGYKLALYVSELEGESVKAMKKNLEEYGLKLEDEIVEAMQDRLEKCGFKVKRLYK